MAPIDLNLPPPSEWDVPGTPCLSSPQIYTVKKRARECTVDIQSSSAPDSKRHLRSSGAAPLHHSAPTACSLFGLPTGRVEEIYHLSGNILGAGQFGSVQSCADRFTGAELACKTVVKNNSQLQIAELKGEVQTMLQVAGHDNIAQIQGVFEENDRVHMVMDLCSGGDLFEETIRRGSFSEHDAAVLFAEAVRAVSYCHARGVLHRDVKPENLLLTRKLNPDAPLSQFHGPNLKLADFGLAVPLRPGQKLKGLAGSPFYMAPEVLDSEYDLKADVWSLGVVLYILLSGSPPFWGEDDDAVFEAIRRGHVDLSTGPWSSISQGAKELVKCLLNQDETRRPSAYRILTHPWLVSQLSPRGSVRHAYSQAQLLSVV